LAPKNNPHLEWGFFITFLKSIEICKCASGSRWSNPNLLWNTGTKVKWIIWSWIAQFPNSDHSDPD